MHNVIARHKIPANRKMVNIARADADGRVMTGVIFVKFVSANHALRGLKFGPRKCKARTLGGAAAASGLLAVIRGYGRRVFCLLRDWRTRKRSLRAIPPVFESRRRDLKHVFGPFTGAKK